MPFYEFETTDKDVKEKKFSVHMSFSEYDKWRESGDAPIHPETGKPVKNWSKCISAPAINFTNPKESSRWDNFEYRAAHNLVQAQEERRNAESKSHMGATPYFDQEGVNLGNHDIENFEGKVL